MEGKPSRQEEEEATKKKEKEPVWAMKKGRLPKGASVIIELPNGTDGEYEEVVRECQNKISLEKMGIPPISMRRVRKGGILIGWAPIAHIADWLI